MAKLLFNKDLTKKAAHAEKIKTHKRSKLVLKVSLALNAILILTLAGAVLWLT